jgi:hypothetical protein
MATFVLVPGACHGAWWYQPVARRLRGRGHLAYAISLTGVGDRAGKVARRYVVAAAWREQSPFTPTADRLRADPACEVIDAPTGHGFADLSADEWTGLIEGGADQAESRP